MYTNNYKHLEDALLFIKLYEKLADCHLVDFITENLWDKCLPDELKIQIEKSNETDCYEIIKKSSELINFTNAIDALNLKNNKNLLTDDVNLSLFNNNCFKKQQEFMKNKKSYEINILSNFISQLWKGNEDIVIDVGAGKGYLGTSLSENYKIPVLSIDSCPSRNKSALEREKLLKKIKNQSFPLVINNN